MRATSMKAMVGAVALAAVVAVPMSISAASAGPRDAKDAPASHEGDPNGQLTILGLVEDGTELVRFDEDRARSLERLGVVAGLSGDSRLIGIDHRVQDGRLYGVGDQGGIYKIFPLQAGGPTSRKVSQLTVALEGTRFGVDFNPAANRLRVVSDSGQNLRHNIDDPAAPTTTTVDGTLTYPPATTPAQGITAAAYTNNDTDTDTSTTLFDLDTMLNQVAVQSPANNGTLAGTGLVGVNAQLNAGFDIYSTVRTGTTVDLDGYATIKSGSRFGLLRGRPPHRAGHQDGHLPDARHRHHDPAQPAVGTSTHPHVAGQGLARRGPGRTAVTAGIGRKLSRTAHASTKSAADWCR